MICSSCLINANTILLPTQIARSRLLPGVNIYLKKDCLMEGVGRYVLWLWKNSSTSAHVSVLVVFYLCSLKTHHIYWTPKQRNTGTTEWSTYAKNTSYVLCLLFSSDRYAIMELRSIANSCQQSFKISTQLLRHLTISVGKQKWVWQHSY